MVTGGSGTTDRKRPTVARTGPASSRAPAPAPARAGGR